MSLSKFDGHTPGPWEIHHDYVFNSSCSRWAIADRILPRNIELIAAAPALLARVRELEGALDVLRQCFPEGSGGREKIGELLEKEWL